MCKRRHTAQATLELAMLLPILAFLLLTFVKLYDVNMSATNAHTETHIQRLEDFDHGNGIIFDPIYGGMVNAGEYIEVVPGSDVIGFDDLGDMIASQAATIAGNRLLDWLYDQMPFFQESNILPEFIRGFNASALNSYIQSGFTEVNVEGALWDGATQSLSSGQATEMFQGSLSDGRGMRELFGSGVQSASTAWTRFQSSLTQTDGGQGVSDAQVLARGMVDGMLSSDTFGSWVDQKYETDADGKKYLVDRTGAAGIAMGAVGGAINATATGAVQGAVDFRDVATSAAYGALYTKSMAGVITGDRYQGDDPRGSMAYGAFNSGVSTLIGGGDFKDAGFRAATGAFYSQQVQGSFGEDQRFAQSAASIAFESGLSFAQGNDLETVGQSALSAAFGYATGQATTWARSEISQRFQKETTAEGMKNAASEAGDEDISALADSHGSGIFSVTGNSIENELAMIDLELQDPQENDEDPQQNDENTPPDGDGGSG